MGNVCKYCRQHHAGKWVESVQGDEDLLGGDPSEEVDPHDICKKYDVCQLVKGRYFCRESMTSRGSITAMNMSRGGIL